MLGYLLTYLLTYLHKILDFTFYFYFISASQNNPAHGYSGTIYVDRNTLVLVRVNIL